MEPFQAPGESACIHCGLCLPACPSYDLTGSEAESPRGRIRLLDALAKGEIDASFDVARHFDLCLGCRACETACPSGVEYGKMVERARPWLEQRIERPRRDARLRARLLAWLPEPSRMRLFRPLLRLANALRVPRLAAWTALPDGIRRAIALLPDPGRPGRLRAVSEPEGDPRGTVGLLTGCVTRVLFPHVNRRSAELLAMAGYRVVVPRFQVCCGALPLHLGDAEGARRRARKNVNVFERSGVDRIVTTAAGCGALVREYGSFLGSNPQYARAGTGVGARSADVVELLGEGGLPRPPRPFVRRIAVHDACHHEHGMGLVSPIRDVLSTIAGAQLVEVPDRFCCGSAGTWNLTEPEMSWELALRKARAILPLDVDMVATANPGCLLQIRAALRYLGSRTEVLHPVEILARAHEL